MPRLLSVAMRVEQWRTLLDLLAIGPFSLRVAGPIYGEVERQLNAQMRIVDQEIPNADDGRADCKGDAP